jgi:hypothetical protein
LERKLALHTMLNCYIEIFKNVAEWHKDSCEQMESLATFLERNTEDLLVYSSF